MKLVHVVPHVDQEASGVSYAVPRLCEALAARGHDVELSCLAAPKDIVGVRVDLHSQWPVLNRFAISTSHASALHRKAGEVDIIHNHSLWSMVNVASGWVAPGRNAKLVTSPHGTLSQWALNRRRKLKRALWLLQRRALSRADLLHATSDDEYREIRALRLTAPVAIVPIGIDLPALPDANVKSSQRTLLYLGRIHPKKGIDHLLRSWRYLQDGHSDWRLIVVGCGEAEHERAMHELVAKLGLRRVEFPGPLYGLDKSKAYFDAALLVLPTHSENFGMVVAEALAHGCPAVVSRGAPWSGLEEEGCGWWVEQDVDTLTQTLDAAMRMPRDRLAERGRKGREWMERDFGWSSVAKKMELAYSWLLSGGVPPEWVKAT